MTHGNRAAARELRGKWLLFPGAKAKPFLAFADRATFVAKIVESAVHPAKSGNRRDEPIKPDCENGAVVHSTDPVSVCLVQPDRAAVAYVAASGTPYFVGMRTHEANITFSHWNEPVTVVRPAKDSVFAVRH